MTGRWPGEHCCRCGQRCVVTFVVDDDVWSAASGEFDRLCTTCFDEMAHAAGVRYVFRELHQASWSQLVHGEWPHLDEPCAECAGRRTREGILRRRTELPAGSG